MSVYTPNIPQAGDVPAQSQPLLLANFQALQDDLNKNHVAISDLANRGKHNFCQFPAQGGNPATALTDGALYTKTSGGTVELFYRNENNGTVYQLTNGLIPRILDGVWNSTAAFSHVIQIPNNTYGHIFLFNLAGYLAQSGWFYQTLNIVNAMAHRLDYQSGTGTSDHVLTFDNQPIGDNFLWARRSLPNTPALYTVKIIYWNI